MKKYVAAARDFLFSELIGWITVEEFDIVLTEFMSAMDFLELGVRIKLACWDTLPRLLYGLAHHIESVARCIAAKCIQLWEDTPPALRDQFDYLSRMFLQVGCLFRTELDRFVNGAPRNMLHPMILREIACFVFAPIVEAPIERTHKDSSQRQGRHAAGPMALSFACRCEPNMERPALKSDDFLP